MFFIPVASVMKEPSRAASKAKNARRSPDDLVHDGVFETKWPGGVGPPNREGEKGDEPFFNGSSYRSPLQAVSIDDDARHLSAATTCLPSSSGLGRTPSRGWSTWKIFKPLFLCRHWWSCESSVSSGLWVATCAPGTERQNPLTPVPASPYLPVLIPVTTRQMLGMQPTPKAPRSAADPTSLLSPKRPCGRLSCSATSTPSSFHSLSSLSPTLIIPPPRSSSAARLLCPPQLPRTLKPFCALDPLLTRGLGQSIIGHPGACCSPVATVAVVAFAHLTA